MNESQRFAYGSNHVDGCSCPATAAGYCPPSAIHACAVAREYDEELATCRSDSGTVDEETAKEAWKAAIRYYERTVKQTPKHKDKEWYQERLDVGKDIARELGWME